MIFNKKMDRPDIGVKIEITWLPVCKNNIYGTPNPYIGMIGTVDYHYPDGKGFCLNTGTSILCVTRGKYKYKLI